jgi:hypothetical protein
MDFYVSAERGWGFRLSTLLVIIFKAGHDSIHMYSTTMEISSAVINMGMYNNMVHLGTHMLSKDVFDKATFNKVNI